jgi:5-deoxy-glucuronate isomerase
VSKLHLRAATLRRGNDPVYLTPSRADWRYCGLDVLRLAAGERRRIRTRARELLVLPLSGACTVIVDGEAYELVGRPNVFAATSDFVYLPVGGEAEVESEHGGEFALPSAMATERLQPSYVPAAATAAEVRGAGRATRLIRNLFLEDGVPAHRLAVVEVLTPPGNWSSYPPHKHDDESTEDEDELEEIYYFRIDGEDGYGLHRTYTADGTLDETVVVRDGDVFLVPHGYHGPCIAAPEFPMYYLNVLAGRSGARGLRYSDDPAYTWIRTSWRRQEPDPRVREPLLALRPEPLEGGAS